MKWYESIEHSNFRNDLKRVIINCSRSLQHHPTFQRLLGQNGSMQYRSMFNDGLHTTPQQLVTDLSRDDMEMVGIAVANTLFLTLIEENPQYAEKLIEDAVGELHNQTAMNYSQAAISAYMGADEPTSDISVDPASVTIRPNNDDYEYWYDLSGDGGCFIVTCDLWEDDEHEDFIAEFEFDPDDADEQQSACDDAEQLVRDLISGKVSLHSLIGNIPGGDRSAIQMPQSLTDKITASDLASIIGSNAFSPTIRTLKTRYGATLSNPTTVFKYPII